MKQTILPPISTADLSVLLTQPTPFHLFGITESRLTSDIRDENIIVPNFSVFRRDPILPQQTGIAVYFHNSIAQYIHRRSDLEIDAIESLWVEVRTDRSSPLLVGFIYRNPAALYTWYDDFVTLVDKARKGRPNILLLGDFNIDLLVPQRAWESTFTMLGFKQLIKDPTRVTETSSTLLDHIYVSEKSRVLSACNLKVAISDHDGVCCNWALKVEKSNRKHQHTTIQYRSFKHFNQEAFLADLSTISFQSVYNYVNPNEALAEWYRLFLGVLDQHVPLREKRVKQAQLPQ